MYMCACTYTHTYSQTCVYRVFAGFDVLKTLCSLVQRVVSDLSESEESSESVTWPRPNDIMQIF